MNTLPFSAVANLAEHIKRCDAWQDRAYEGFGLQRMMFDDIASMSNQGEDDLQSILSFFAESAKERLSAPGGKWSWRTRDAIASHKSPYLDWLKSQWANGRWKDDVTIHPSTRHFLDPRFARFESLSYLPGAKNQLGRSWPEVVKGYRDVVGQEARHRSAVEPLAANKVSKAGVEEYVLLYFERRGWVCHSAASQIGNILTVERPLPDSEHVFRLAISLADKGLLDHIGCWVSVTDAGTDLRMVNGGSAALVAAPMDGLLLPASTYYLTHDRERLRIVNAVAFIDSVLQAMMQPAQVA